MRKPLAILLACVALMAVSCSKDKPADDVVGTYKGYTLADSRVFSDFFTDNESLTLTKVDDNTVDLNFVSGRWGTFAFSGIDVAGKNGAYTLSASGKCSMPNHSGTETDYDCTMSASLQGNGKGTLSFTIDAVMGGTEIRFYPGDAPLGHYVADKYTGEMLRHVVKDPVHDTGIVAIDTNTLDITLKATTGNCVSISMPAYGKGHYLMPAITIEKVLVSSDDPQHFTLGETAIDVTENGVNYTGTLKGTVNNGRLVLNMTVYAGAMPMPIVMYYYSTSQKE